MNKQTEALKLALDFIEEVDYPPYDDKPVITAIREALAEQPTQQQEPVAMSIIEQALNMPLDDFTKLLGMRPRNCIRANMWSPFETDEHLKPPHTVRHLMMFSRKEMARWPNLGKKSLNEIEENLRSLGLQLWHEHDERSLKPLMEAPVQAQERKPLTDDEIAGWFGAATEGSLIEFARAIEAAHGITGEQK